MLNQDTIREATRLTHAGELAEATALLQRMLRGVCVPDATSRTAGRVPLSDREPLTIDAKVNDIEEADSTHLARAPFGLPRRLQPLFDRAKDGSWLGMRGAKRTPPSTADILPEGAKFIESAYSNPAGCQKARSSSKALTATRREAALTSSSSPAAIRGSRFPWS